MPCRPNTAATLLVMCDIYCAKCVTGTLRTVDAKIGSVYTGIFIFPCEC